MANETEEVKSSSKAATRDRREFAYLHLRTVSNLAFYVVSGFFTTVLVVLLGPLDLERPNVSMVVGIIIGHTSTMAGAVVASYFHSRLASGGGKQPDGYIGPERRAGLDRREEDLSPLPDPPGERRTGSERRGQRSGE